MKLQTYLIFYLSILGFGFAQNNANSHEALEDQCNTFNQLRIQNNWPDSKVENGIVLQLVSYEGNQPIYEENDPSKMNILVPELVITENIDSGTVKKVAQKIIANNEITGENSHVEYIATQSIELTHGFRATNAHTLLKIDSAANKQSTNLVLVCNNAVSQTIIERDNKVTERDLGQDFKLFPNPTDGMVTIKLPEQTDGNIMLYDLGGKLAFQDEFKDSYQLHLDLQQLNLQKGIYLIIVITNEEKYSSKVIYK